MSKRFEIIDPVKKKFEILRISDETLLSQIDPIEQGGLTPDSKEELKTLVEAPLLEACQILYNKNIKTLFSSANKKDLSIGKVYITIDYNSLSLKNQEIARNLGEIHMSHGGTPVPAINLSIPVSEKTTVGQI